MIMPRKKRRVVRVSVIIFILIIIATIFIILYNMTDMFKPNNVLFEKYTRQLFDNINQIFDEEHMSEMEEILNNNKLEYNKATTINYDANGDTSNPINSIAIDISGQEEKSSEYNYQNVQIQQNEETLIGVEYLESENIAGVRLNGIKQYLSTNTENENENGIYNLYKLIHTDVQELLGITMEEWNTLKEKYIEMILGNVINANFSRQTDVLIEINGVQYNTNVYSITITKEQFNNIYMQILENLETEEIILSKLEEIDNKINEYYNLIENEETSNIKQEYIDKIENTIQKIKDYNIGTDERTISVFESEGIAISLSIDTEEDFIGLDVVNGENSNFINILENEKIEEGEEKNSFDFKVEKTAETNNETIKLQYNTVEEGQEIINECSIDRNIENSNINSKINLGKNVNGNVMEINIESTSNIVNDFEEKEEFVENENNIIVENLSDEQRENVINNLEENMSNQINTFLQVVSLDNIKQMLISLNLMEEELDDLSGEETVTEVERNRFNSTFELYEGENITKERVEELIDIAKEDLGDVRITRYDEEENEDRVPLEYRLVIEKGINNTELAESVIEYIEENYNEDFSVRLEYDETTGFINNIYIEVIEN